MECLTHPPAYRLGLSLSRASKPRLWNAIWASLALACSTAAQPDAPEAPFFQSEGLDELERLQFHRPPALANTAISGVNAIAQCPMGFIWFGSKQGAFRYDGYRIKAYQHHPDSPTSLSHNTVWSFLIDSRGRHWIGTQKGVSRLRPETDTFSHYLTGPSWPNPSLSNRVNALVESSDGEVMACTEAGIIYRYDESNDQFTQVNASPLGLIKSMTIDPQDRLWVGVENGLIRYSPRERQSKRFIGIFNRQQDIGNNFINNILFETNERIWVGTSNSGVALLDSVSNAVEFLPLTRNGDQYVHQIRRDPSGNTWVASNGGIAVYPENARRAVHLSEETQHGQMPIIGVNSMLADNQGNIWIGSNYDGVSLATRAKGFYKLPLHRYNSESHPNAPVSAFLKDSRGNFWVGDAKSGLDLYARDNSVRRFRHDPEDPTSITAQPVLSIFEDSRGDIWVGTFRGGLHRYQPETESFQKYLPDSSNPHAISGMDIRGFAEDEKGNLWINTHSTGIDYLDLQTGRFANFRASSTESRFTIIEDWNFTIEYDASGQLWIGSTLGLSILNSADGSVRNFQADPASPGALANSTINDIYQDSSQRMWLATDDGLHLYLPETQGFAQFSMQHGFPHRTIVSIVEDDHGILWLGTYNGLARFDPATKRAKSYHAGDGLASNEFFEGSAFKDDLGLIYFGQNKGITRFDPASIQDNLAPPPVYITGLQIFNEPLRIEPDNKGPGVLQRSVLHTRSIELRPEQKVVTLEFIALNYIRSNENKYSYKLEGFDREWSPADTRRSVTYTNLNPGHYTFRVRASNNDGYWNEAGSSLAIQILPPFWATAWFRGLAILLALALPASLVFWRLEAMKQAKKRLELAVEERTSQLQSAHLELEKAYAQILAHGEDLEETVRKRTEELEVAKSNAERSDRLKSAFLANMSHEIRTPMNAIIGFLHFLDREDLGPQERERYSRIIHQSSQSLLSLIDDILDLSTIEAGEAEIGSGPTNIDEICEELFTVFHESLAKHADKDVSLKLTIANQGESATPSNHFVELDPLRLKQILWNLLSNAVKFTESGEIRFGYRVTGQPGEAAGQRLEFTVEDSGIGIPADQCSDLFKRFHKVERDGQKLYRGTGLGLAITKKLTELMQGDITVESRAGHGTRFTVSFPYLPIHPSCSLDRRPLRKGFAARHLPDWSEWKILVAEDEDPNFEYIQNVLQDTGIGIKRARDGEEAVNLFEMDKGRFDLVLLDLKMPGIDGHEVARRIRRRNPSIPIIVQSAFAMQSDRDDSLREGASEHLCKPFRPEELISQIEHHLSQAPKA